MSGNIFLKPIDYYQREINPLGQYVQQNAFYLSKMTGKDFDKCKAFIAESIKTNKFPEMIDPVVRFFNRDHNGDKFQDQCRLSTYISNVVKNEEILVPTFTSYVPTKKKKSLIVGFVDNNVKIRSKAKKEAHKAKADGKNDLFVMKNNEQDNRKRYNNSMSGAFAAEGSVLNNPTGHSTLTTITRICSSLGNASNEKIISGNRHYRNPDVTLSNVIFITSRINKEELQKVIQKYGLVYPTVEDTLDCIRHSSDFYWRDPKAFKKIENFVLTLEPIERAGFVYCGDLFHLRKHNSEFINNFLSNLSKKVTGCFVENAIDVIHKTDEQVVNFAHIVCMSEVRGKGKDYARLTETEVMTLAATCVNIVHQIETFRDFITSIFLTENIPASVAYIPNMLRRTVVLSDTDSTMFSVDEWVKWKFGQVEFTDEAYGFSASVMFIATQCIAHNLAIFSANMNVEREKLFMLAMKPEFLFSVFCQTPVAKHYFTAQLVKEGNVHKEPEMEIKGVYLKNSAAPKSLIQDSQKRMKFIIEQVVNGKPISIIDELTRVADVERKIHMSLLNGDTEFYTQSKIKSPEAYAGTPEQSPYQHHVLWTEVFAPKYNVIEPLAYSVIKIPTTIETKTDMKNWLDRIEDRELSDRLSTWLQRMKKTCLPTMYISTNYVKAFGIPAEIKPIINVKKIVLNLTITDRMILETLGYCPKMDRLISELGY